MTPEELKDLFRREVDDREAPGGGDSSESLWSDEDIYAYMDEAQKLFARETSVLLKNVTVEMTEGDPYVDLSSYNILKVRTGRIASSNRVITPVNTDRLETVAMEDDYGAYFRTDKWRDTTGDPFYIVLDDVGDAGRLVPYYEALAETTLASSADAEDLALTLTDGSNFSSSTFYVRLGEYDDYEIVTVSSRSGNSLVVSALANDWPAGTRVLETTRKELTLNVYRLPLNDISETSSTFELVDVRHQRALVHYMKYLAYLKQDADTYDPKSSERARNVWDGIVEDVRREVRRKRFKMHTVRYGGL